MPGIDLVNRKIAFEMFQNFEKPKAILYGKTNDRVLSAKYSTLEFRLDGTKINGENNT